MLVCVCYVDLLLYLFAFMFVDLFFFFFKQKTAYEIRLSLVGSEMCIRDRTMPERYLSLQIAPPQSAVHRLAIGDRVPRRMAGSGQYPAFGSTPGNRSLS